LRQSIFKAFDFQVAGNQNFKGLNDAGEFWVETVVEYYDVDWDEKHHTF